MELTHTAAPFWLIMVCAVAGVGAGLVLFPVVRHYDREGSAPAGAGARILTVAATSLLFMAMAHRFALSWQLPAYLTLAAAAPVLTMIDIKHHLLPNAVLLRVLLAGFALLVLAAGLEEGWTALLRAALGALVLFLVYLVLALVSPASLGMGDVKLAAVLGFYLGYQGWGSVVVGLLATFGMGALVALAVLATRRGGLRSDVPFGPSMLAGALMVVVWGESAVISLVFPAFS